MADAHEIAGNLTKAQRQAIIILAAPDWSAGPDLPEHVLDRLRAMEARGLVERHFGDMSGTSVFIEENEAITFRLSACWWFRLTPLGEAVRAILQETDHG